MTTAISQDCFCTFIYIMNGLSLGAVCKANSVEKGGLFSTSQSKTAQERVKRQSSAIEEATVSAP